MWYYGDSRIEEEVVLTKTWQRLGLFLVLSGIGICVLGLGQISITLPGGQQGAFTGNAIDFGDVAVGTTKTATYTFTISATSSTAGTVTFIGFSGGYFERPPFALTDLPSLPTTIAPGRSITFHVTFSPTVTRTYSDGFTITVSGGWPATTKTQTVTLTGRGVAGDGSGTDTSGQYDFTRLQTTIDTTRQDIARLEAKLDRLPGQLPGEDVAKLEVKLDELYSQLTDWYVTLEVDVGKIWTMLGGFSPFGSALTGIQSAVDTLETKLDGLQPTLDDIEMDLSMLVDGVRDLDSGSAQNAANAITVEAKLDALDMKLGEISGRLDRLSADAPQQGDGELETKLDAQEVKLDDLQSALTAMQAQIRANSTAIAALQASNTRIEEMLNRLLAGSGTEAVTPPPDASKITAVLEKIADGSAADYRITVTGSAGSTLPKPPAAFYATLVNIYLEPGGQPFPRGVGPDGSFSSILANPRSVASIEVTQVVDGRESPPVRIELSSDEQAEAPPPPDVSKITMNWTMGMGANWEPNYTRHVKGGAGAVNESALVTLYWCRPFGGATDLLVDTISAQVDGSFDFSAISDSRALDCVEITQTVQGRESTRIRIELSLD